MVTEDRKERIAFLLAQQKRRFAEDVKPIKCLRVKGQIPLSEYPFINDRVAKIQRDVQIEEYRRYWGKPNKVEIPELKYHSSDFTPVSLVAFFRGVYHEGLSYLP